MKRTLDADETSSPDTKRPRLMAPQDARSTRAAPLLIGHASFSRPPSRVHVTPNLHNPPPTSAVTPRPLSPSNFGLFDCEGRPSPRGRPPRARKPDNPSDPPSTMGRGVDVGERVVQPERQFLIAEPPLSLPPPPLPAPSPPASRKRKYERDGAFFSPTYPDGSVPVSPSDGAQRRAIAQSPVARPKASVPRPPPQRRTSAYSSTYAARADSEGPSRKRLRETADEEPHRRGSGMMKPSPSGYHPRQPENASFYPSPPQLDYSAPGRSTLHPMYPPYPMFVNGYLPQLPPPASESQVAPPADSSVSDSGLVDPEAAFADLLLPPQPQLPIPSESSSSSAQQTVSAKDLEAIGTVRALPSTPACGGEIGPAPEYPLPTAEDLWQFEQLLRGQPVAASEEAIALPGTHQNFELSAGLEGEVPLSDYNWDWLLNCSAPAPSGGDPLDWSVITSNLTPSLPSGSHSTPGSAAPPPPPFNPPWIQPGPSSSARPGDSFALSFAGLRDADRILCQEAMAYTAACASSSAIGPAPDWTPPYPAMASAPSASTSFAPAPSPTHLGPTQPSPRGSGPSRPLPPAQVQKRQRRRKGELDEPPPSPPAAPAPAPGQNSPAKSDKALAPPPRKPRQRKKPTVKISPTPEPEPEPAPLPSLPPPSTRVSDPRRRPRNNASTSAARAEAVSHEDDPAPPAKKPRIRKKAPQTPAQLEDVGVPAPAPPRLPPPPAGVMYPATTRRNPPDLPAAPRTAGPSTARTDPSAVSPLVTPSAQPPASPAVPQGSGESSQEQLLRLYGRTFG
ncbi:hypothetical protein C8Q77DRAFT_1162126 [Trametes polyzona]|nr:hypothetical protein C8Q77DRAFT_1162126 [Trametes polyzona]